MAFRADREWAAYTLPKTATIGKISDEVTVCSKCILPRQRIAHNARKAGRR